jgi:hypothetical protein
MPNAHQGEQRGFHQEKAPQEDDEAQVQQTLQGESSQEQVRVRYP